MQRHIMFDECLQRHSSWLGHDLRVHRMAEIASDVRVVSHDPLTQRLCGVSLLQSFNIQPPYGSNSPCVLRAIGYGAHLGSEIPLLSGLVRPFFNSNVRDPRVRSHLGEVGVSNAVLTGKKSLGNLDVRVLLPVPCPQYGRQRWTHLLRAL